MAVANAGRPDLDHLVRAAHVPDGEPVFLLRARDPAASQAVRAWAVAAHALGVDIAVVEQALIQADHMDGWPTKQRPGVDHLGEAEQKQLRYQHSRRGWRSREDVEPTPDALLLAERRGWDAAMASVRASLLETAP